MAKQEKKEERMLATGELLTIRQAAQRLDCTSEWVRQLVLAGELPAINTPLGRLFRVAAVDRLAEERRQRKQMVAANA